VCTVCSTGPASLDCLEKIAMHALDACLQVLMQKILALRVY
jgi:hypothetical protein